MPAFEPSRFFFVHAEEIDRRNAVASIPLVQNIRWVIPNRRSPRDGSDQLRSFSLNYLCSLEIFAEKMMYIPYIALATPDHVTNVPLGPK